MSKLKEYGPALLGFVAPFTLLVLPGKVALTSLLVLIFVVPLTAQPVVSRYPRARTAWLGAIFGTTAAILTLALWMPPTSPR